METAGALTNAQGKPLLDEHGKLRKDQVTGLAERPEVAPVANQNEKPVAESHVPDPGFDRARSHGCPFFERVGPRGERDAKEAAEEEQSHAGAHEGAIGRENRFHRSRLGFKASAGGSGQRPGRGVPGTTVDPELIRRALDEG